jgi:hypothetical protein
VSVTKPSKDDIDSVEPSPLGSLSITAHLLLDDGLANQTKAAEQARLYKSEGQHCVQANLLGPDVY